MILALRRKVSIKVRQPLSKIMIPILNNEFKEKFEAIKDLVFNEVNVKDVDYISDTSGILVKKIKPNFKTLGPKYGKQMKEISKAVNQMSQEDIIHFEKEGHFYIETKEKNIDLSISDVDISSEDIPGWLVTNDNDLTVALDIHITEDLRDEGIARELINRIQNIRKDSNFEVTDKIIIDIQKHYKINNAITKHLEYISTQTLALEINLVEKSDQESTNIIEINDEIKTYIKVSKIN